MDNNPEDKHPKRERKSNMDSMYEYGPGLGTSKGSSDAKKEKKKTERGQTKGHEKK